MPYRTPPAPPPQKPPRSRWARLLCFLGFHEGPFNIWLHSIDCEACGRIVDD